MKRSREEDSLLVSGSTTIPGDPVKPCYLSLPIAWVIWHEKSRQPREATEKEILLKWFLLKEIIHKDDELPVDIFYGVMAPLTIELLTVISQQGLRVRLYESIIANMIRAFANGYPRISFYCDRQRYSIYKEKQSSYFLNLVVHSPSEWEDEYESDGGACFIYRKEEDIEEASKTRVDILLSQALVSTKSMGIYG